MKWTFEDMLKGGHPNSLGRTVAVVDLVLTDRSRFADLYRTWFSHDEIVRLRVANAVKRVTTERPEWTMDVMDGLLSDVAAIDQPSTQWTLALIFDLCREQLSTAQIDRAVEIMKRNLETHDDWIVLNNSMKVLSKWAKDDRELAEWLVPHLERLKGERRKSVAGQARKALALVEKALA